MTDLSGTHPHAAFMTDLPDGNYSDYNADPAMARLQNPSTHRRFHVNARQLLI
jgi:hypothetical protein